MNFRNSVHLMTVVALGGCTQHPISRDVASWAPQSANFQVNWQPDSVVLHYGDVPTSVTASSCEVGPVGDLTSEIREGKSEAVLVTSDRCLIQVTPRGYWFEHPVAVVDLVRIRGCWLVNGIGLWHWSDAGVILAHGRMEPRWCPVSGDLWIDGRQRDANRFGVHLELHYVVGGQPCSMEAQFLAAAQEPEAELPWLSREYLADVGEGH